MRVARLLTAVVIGFTTSTAYGQTGVSGFQEWHLEEQADPITDAKRVTVAYATDKVMMIFQCSEGVVVSVLSPIDPMTSLEFMQVERTTPVQWRVGKNPSHSESWMSMRSPGGGGHNIAAMGSEMAKETASGSGDLIVRAHGMTFTFPLAGAAVKINQTVAACS